MYRALQAGSSPSASALMDPRPTSLQELFSRSNSPPAQIQHQHISNTSSPNHLESLFHQLNAPPQQQQAPSPPQPVHQQQQQPINQPSASYSPAPPAEEQAAPPPQPTNAERQTALLSLLSGPAPAPAPRPVQPAQQVPSPPISHKSNASPSHNEAQGKYLLEQLMAGYVLSLDPAYYLSPKMLCQRLYIVLAYARARGAGMPLSLLSLSFSPYSMIRILV